MEEHIRMAICNECHIFLIDALPCIKFTPSIESAVNKKRWIRHSAELASFCIEFANLVPKIEYENYYQNIIAIFKVIMPENANIQRNVLDEQTYYNLLITIDNNLKDKNPAYKSLRDHVHTLIVEKQYVKENRIGISTELLWLYCADYYMKVYSEVHAANPVHKV
jgi:hypothetical protein